jgi:hypothetical protein
MPPPRFDDKALDAQVGGDGQVSFSLQHQA